MSDNYSFAQGQAKPATAEDLQKDVEGVTDPNLHRRFNVDSNLVEDYISTEDGFILEIDDDFVLTSMVDEIVETPYSYMLTVQGVNSYRNTTKELHDEDADDSEIP